jgi:hypothetical protein
VTPDCAATDGVFVGIFFPDMHGILCIFNAMQLLSLLSDGQNLDHT